jgi:hypothetical protein
VQQLTEEMKKEKESGLLKVLQLPTNAIHQIKEI